MGRSTKSKRVGDYEIGEKIGEGAFSKVFVGTNGDGQKFAVKVVEKKRIKTDAMREQVRRELAIMKLLKHPNVVDLHDVMVSKTKVYMILELVTGGELFFKLAEEKRFDEPTSRKYFHQIISAIEYCHSQGVVHRDLKPENLLLAANGDVKVTDFGLSAMRTDNDQDEMFYTTCGTPNYVAPEVLSTTGYQGEPADVWSCGVMLYVFLAGFLPFRAKTERELFAKIKTADFKFPPWFSSGAMSLLDQILKVDPTERYTIAQIKNHKWFLVDWNPRSPLPNVDRKRAGTQHFSDVEERVAPTRVPSKTNVFDLISRSGMLNLGRMLLPQSEAASSVVTLSTRFFTELEPEKALHELEDVFEDMPVGMKSDETNYKLKITAPSPGGLIAFDVQLFVVTRSPPLYLVEFLRSKGDSLEFFQLFDQVRQLCSSWRQHSSSTVSSSSAAS